MSSSTQRLSLDDIRKDPELLGILLTHAYRGIRIQVLLRVLLVVFMALTVIIVPPAHYRAWCYVTVVVYAIWVGAVTRWSQQGGERPVQLVWLALFIDVLALAALTVLASLSDQESWTADILLNGFFLIPMLATTQLRPGVGTAVTVPTVLVYLLSSIAARHANGEPWASVLLRTGILAALSLGCVLLSAMQRSRVLTIAGLVSDRTQLVRELVNVEAQARRDLAEDSTMVRCNMCWPLVKTSTMSASGATPSPWTGCSTRQGVSALLRSKVSQLHPAVLEQSGLRGAIKELVRTMADRGSGLSVSLDAEGWDEAWRTSADDLVYSAARELLANAVKHAQPVPYRSSSAVATAPFPLTVADDGIGIAEGELERQLSKGHIGVASQRVRVRPPAGSSTSGRLPLAPSSLAPIATVELPAIDLASS